MPSARCPDCDTLRKITPTGERIGEGTAQWWRIEEHEIPTVDDDPLSYRSRIVVERCEGSGKRV